MKKKRVIIGAGFLLVGLFVLVFHPDRPLWISTTPLTVVAPDGVKLSASLSIPRWKRVIGAVVMVHGSGPLTRESLRGDVRRLVSLGFAVLHYDKRGTGFSEGVYSPSSQTPMTELIAVLSGDAAAAMNTLHGVALGEEVPIGFFGASQAGWILPAAVARCQNEPDFLVILSGTPVSTGVEGYYSELTGDGMRPPSLTDRGEIERLTLAYRGDPGFDPIPTWRSLKIPTLWILGREDLSVPTFASLPLLESLRKEGHTEHEFVVFPETGHDLRHVPTGAPQEIWVPLMDWFGRLPTR